MNSATSRLMLWLSGVDLAALARCERERSKFVAMGATVVMTSVFAAVAATFTVHLYLHAPLMVAIVVGLLWGLAIMNLDRWLLISIRRQKSAAKTVMLAVPRVILAILVGILIAEPLVLKVFEDEITGQAARERKEEIRDQFVSIPRLQERQTELQAELTGAGGAGVALLESPAYTEAKAQLDSLEARAARANRAAICELDGSCGTSKRGYGPAYEAKNEIAGQLGGQVAEARAQLQAVRSRLLAQEDRLTAHARGFDRSELGRVRAQLRELRSQRQEDAQELRDDFGEKIGLLDRIEALGTLTGEHPAMLWLRVVLFLCILAIDTLPALAKVLMSVGEPTAYERAQKSLDSADVDAVEKQVSAYMEANTIDAAVIVDEANIRREAVKEVQDELVAQAVDGMREAGERFIAAWREAVVDSVDDLADAELKRTGLRPASGQQQQEETGQTNGSGGGEP